VLGGDTHDNGRTIRKRGLEDVMVRARAEAAHLDRRTADRGSCQISGDGCVWRVGHERMPIGCRSSRFNADFNFVI
jgi:hypothetical protein